MVVGVFSGGGAGGNRLFDDRLEISPLRVSEQFLQIPREPVFDTACLVGVSTAFKVSMKLMNDFFVHNVALYFPAFSLQHQRLTRKFRSATLAVAF